MNKAALIVGLAFIGFFVVLAGFIGSRLNEQTITVLASLTCGVGVATPIGAAIGWTLRGRRSADRSTVPPQQPIMVVTQPQLPQHVQPAYAAQPVNNTWGSAYPAGQNQTPRQFTIVGEEPTHHEPDSIW